MPLIKKLTKPLLLLALLAGLFLVSHNSSLAQNEAQKFSPDPGAVIPLQTGIMRTEALQRQLPVTNPGIDLGAPPAGPAPDQTLSHLLSWLLGLAAFVLLILFAYLLTRPPRLRSGQALMGKPAGAKPAPSPALKQVRPHQPGVVKLRQRQSRPSIFRRMFTALPVRLALKIKGRMKTAKILLKQKRIALPAALVIITAVIAGYLVFRPQTPGYAINIPASYDQELEIIRGNMTLGLVPMASAEVPAKFEHNQYIYSQPYPNTDVIQTETGNKIKEELIFSQSGHPLKLEYKIRNAAEYLIEKNSNGDLVFYDRAAVESGQSKNLARVFTIPRPYLEDSHKTKSFGAVDLSAENDTLIYTLDQTWLTSAAYPVTLDPTIEINILNVHSHPGEGDNWIVSFTTVGRADLKIIPVDSATIEDDEFVSLWCGDEQRTPEILEGDVIYYKNWECNDQIARVIHYTVKAGRHTLRFEFGDPNDPDNLRIAYAYNNPITPVIQSITNSNQGTNSTSFSMNMPSPRPAGDLYVAVVGKDGTNAIVPPAGWTEIYSLSDTSGIYHGAYYHVGGASEPSSYTFTSANEQWSGAILRLTDYDKNGFINATNTAYGSSINPTAPAVTPTASSTLILYTATIDTKAWAAAYEPAGTSKVFSQESTPGAGSNSASTAAASKTGTSTQSTGTGAFTAAASDDWGAGTVAITGTPALLSSAYDQVFYTGQAASNTAAIIITAAAAGAITQGGDIRLKIATSAVDMAWDTSVGSISVTGSGSGNVSTSVSYSGSSTLIIDVQTDFSAGQTITVSGLKFKNFNHANAAYQSALVLYLGGAADTVIDGWDNKTVTIYGTLAAGNHTLGQVGNQWSSDYEATTSVHYRYQLTSSGEDVNVGTTTINLTGVYGVSAGDITGAKLYVDINGNGVASTSIGEYTGTSFSTPGDTYPAGIAYGEGFFWISDGDHKKVYKYQTDGTYTGTSFDTNTSGSTYPLGIAYYNGFLWITDVNQEEVYKYQTDGTYTGTSFDTNASGNTSPRGITYYNGFFWITDIDTIKVYKYQTDGTYTGTFFDTNASGNTSPRGITYYNGFFWIIDYNYTQGKVYKYQTDGTYTGTSFDTNITALGITYYHGFLWVTDDTNRVCKYGSASVADYGAVSINGTTHTGTITFATSSTYGIAVGTTTDFLVQLTASNATACDQMTMDFGSASSTGYISGYSIVPTGDPSSVKHYVDGAITVENHYAGQAGNQWVSIGSATTSVHYRFRLDPNGTITLATTTIDLSAISGVNTNDITNIKLYKDNNSNGVVDSGPPPPLSGPILVSTSETSYATYENNSRKLVHASSNTLYATYHKKSGSYYEIYVASSTDNGATWQGATLISTYSGMDGYSQYYPSIAVDGNDHLHVVWHGNATGYTSGSQIWYAEYNGAWQTPVRLSTYSGMDTSSNGEGYPSIVVDSSDHLHVVWYGDATGYTNYQIWYAEYNGAWQTPVRLSTYSGMDSYNQNAPSIAVDGNDHLHVVWYGDATGYTSGAQIWYAEYNGAWQTPVRLSTYSGMNSYSQNDPSIAADGNDHLHVVWAGEATGYTSTNQIWYAEYNGAAWQTPVRLSTYSGMDSSSHQVDPSIAADGNDHLHVVWDGKATGYTDYKVWYAKYTTGWAEPAVLQPTGQNRYPNVRWSRYPASNIPTDGMDYVFTEGTASPYDIYWASTGTPFSGSGETPISSGAVSISDTTGTITFATSTTYQISATTDFLIELTASNLETGGGGGGAASQSGVIRIGGNTFISGNTFLAPGGTGTGGGGSGDTMTMGWGTVESNSCSLNVSDSPSNVTHTKQ
jgi:hypothetical protein